MQRLHRYLILILLLTALGAPVALQARNRCPDRDGRHGYWDNDSRRCHYWDEREDHSYRAWQAQNKINREYAKLKAKEQREYWKWRREHPDDNDHDRR